MSVCKAFRDGSGCVNGIKCSNIHILTYHFSLPYAPVGSYVTLHLHFIGPICTRFSYEETNVIHRNTSRRARRRINRYKQNFVLRMREQIQYFVEHSQHADEQQLSYINLQYENVHKIFDVIQLAGY